MAKAILGHWQVNGIASFISGTPTAVSATTTTGADITGSPTDPLSRPDITGNAVLSKSQRTIYQYFNTSVFRLPATGTPGNGAKTAFRGPGTNNWDLSLLKSFTVYRERARIEFRAEAYNAFNAVNFTNPSLALYNPSTFGEFQSTTPPREMQFALRYEF